MDLVRGAVDAQLHTPSRVPAGAALLSGGMWTLAAAGALSQPVPPDWPGHLTETLPFALVAVGAGLVATIGLWARRSDAAGRIAVPTILFTIIGHVAWVAALLVALFGLEYGSVTAAAQAVGAMGCLAVGLVLLRNADQRLGGLLVIAPTFLLFGWPVAWLGFGLAWTVAGVLLLAELGRDESRLSPSG
jgi:hypothetical protein